MCLRPRSTVMVAIAVVAVVASLAACTSPTPPPATIPTTSPAGPTVVAQVGASDLGDPYAPGAGNGGYDVAHYDLKLRYEPATKQLSGSATITATATAALARFDLDFRALKASAVTVNGTPATTAVTGDELVITPATPLAAGASFTVAVTYAGVPKAYSEPGLGQVGFLSTPDGAIAIGEPEVAASWFPANDHPRDKASYTITIAAPQELAALSNGVLTSKVSAGGFTTWTWTESAPMASYLATVVIGRYRVHQSTHDGKPVVTAVADSLPTTIDDYLARTPEVVDFLATTFGPYPFDAMGGIAISDSRIRFALENQTRPIYANTFFTNPTRGVSVIAHELAHQWFGDSVSVHDWTDVWLNEGFATYAQWLWAAAHGGMSVQQAFDDTYDRSPPLLWQTPPGVPPKDDLFTDRSGSVYDRGAMTLHALRITVGDAAFFTIVRDWATQRAGGTGTTAQLLALAEQVSGRQLDRLFADWLYGSVRPPRPAPA